MALSKTLKVQRYHAWQSNEIRPNRLWVMAESRSIEKSNSYENQLFDHSNNPPA